MASRLLSNEAYEQPEWLQPCAVVHVQCWCGIVDDVCVSPTSGRIMLFVRSMKELRQGRTGEWLEYLPQQIRPAYKHEIENELRRNDDLCDIAQAQLRQVHEALVEELDK